MAERRGMGQALTLTPEKIAFITGGRAPAEPGGVPGVLPPAAPTATRRTLADVPKMSDQTAVVSGPTRSRRSRTSTQPPRSGISLESTSTNFNGQLLVPITTRLRPTTANALRRACLEMKLRGEQPNCQQDVAETAIANWLRENGFL